METRLGNLVCQASIIFKIIFSVGLYFLVTGCASKYQNQLGKYRPSNPKYTISNEVESLSSLDTVPFEVLYAFETYSENYDGRLVRDVIIFSSDGRFTTIPLDVDEPADNLVLNRDPWLAGEQVGFYKIKGDTVLIEYFANFSWGIYYTMEGVFEGSTLGITGAWQGVGRWKKETNMPYRKRFTRIEKVITLY